MSNYLGPGTDEGLSHFPTALIPGITSNEDSGFVAQRITSEAMAEKLFVEKIQPSREQIIAQRVYWKQVDLWVMVCGELKFGRSEARASGTQMHSRLITGTGC